ncbi:hypothetical protein ACJ41O_010995 [Fusarium nematophilum]
MDPISLTLAVAPIAAGLLKACLAGYDVLQGASTVGENAQVAMCRLQIEQTRLRLWADNLTADRVDIDSQLDARGIKDLVVMILAQICNVITDTKKLRAHYGLSFPQAEPRVTPQPARDAAFGLRSEAVARAEAMKQYAEQVQQSVTFLKRLKFTLKDKDKFNDLLDQLRYYNDSLASLMPPLQRARLELTLSSRVVSSTTDPAELAQIRDASRENDKGLSSAAMMKRFRLLAHSPNASYVSASELRCTRSWLELDDPRAPRSKGKYGAPGSKQDVVAEWKDYDRNLPREVSVDRIQDIARYLHVSSSYRSPDLPVLECIGYVEDIERARCCFLYSAPEDMMASESDRTLTTLEDLMPSKFDPSKTPNLEHRLQLARRLAAAVFRLHLTGWLHKGIRSSNIIFPQATKGELSGNSNAILMGFDYSRPDRPQEESDQSPHHGSSLDLYVHPEYQHWGNVHGGTLGASGNSAVSIPGQTSDKRYKRKYDIYSLGVLLLEVALWQPVKSFYKQSFSSSQFLDALLEVVETL